MRSEQMIWKIAMRIRIGAMKTASENELHILYILLFIDREEMLHSEISEKQR